MSKILLFSYKLISCVVLLTSLLFISTSIAFDASEHEKAKQKSSAQLNSIQQAIAKQESNIFNTNKARSALEQQLKNGEQFCNK